MKLLDFLYSFVKALYYQIESDQKRWGDTWRHRPAEGQVDRMMARFKDYQDQHNHAGIPVPWLKIAGEALIGWVRDNNPEYFIKVEES